MKVLTPTWEWHGVRALIGVKIGGNIADESHCVE